MRWWVNKNALKAAAGEGFYSRQGYFVDFNSPRWVLSKDVGVQVETIEEFLDVGLLHGFKRVLCYFAKSHSPSHVVNMFDRCKAYLVSTIGQNPFSVASLISYYSTLNEKTEWYMGVIRVFLRQWSRLGYQGLPEGVMTLLDKWVIKGNEKGFVVQSMCPESGPLTDIEMEGVVVAIIEALSARRLTLEDASCALLLAMTGRRPIQITGLKVKDLLGLSTGKYWINFPRAKQRAQSWRSEFNEFAIVEDIYLLLQQQATAVEERFAELIGERVPAKLIGYLPLFPVLDNVSPGMDLRERLAGDSLHAPTNRLNRIMRRVADTVAVISERTGAPVALNPSRFRYTLGTNLAREGRGELIIAEALDHSDTQNVGVYVKNIPDIVERIDKAVALQLAPYAQAFRGVLVESESKARRGDDPRSRISTGRSNVGTCGSYGFCGALAPVACYTCAHFQPWINGPHEEVLDLLIEERDRVRDNCGDLKIASANDRLILAVGDVINRCREVRGEVMHG